MVKRSQAVTALCVLALLAATFPGSLRGQTSQGPEQGTSAAGALVNTGDFASLPAAQPAHVEKARKHRIELIPDPIGLRIPTAPVGFNEQDDLARALPDALLPSAPVLVTNFQGITMTNFIPPDPILAAGPSHLMPVVNSDFAIFDKSGNNLQQIDAASWFSNVLPAASPFDPKVIYDHFDDRWVMVWLAGDFSTTSFILVSVSDDSDPNGAWCSWAFDGTVNGSTAANNASDYQGLGFDENAVYVAPNQFSLSTGFFEYAKIRILPKSTLYDSGCPAVTFTDFWDLTDPDFTTVNVATVRPAVTFGTPGVQYLINDSPFVTGTTVTVWELTNPLAVTPTLIATNVAVTAREVPPDAGQLANVGTDIDTQGPNVRNVVYRDGSLWTAQSVADASGQFARARYVRIDASGLTATEDVSFGDDDCWLYYPAITSNVNSDIVIVFTRSCVDEHPSIRYTGRANGESGLQPSAELKAGEAGYEILDGFGRNRWGDYSGAAVDPVNTGRIWIVGEYAESPMSTWGTWIGEASVRVLGDVNDDGVVDVADITLLVEFVLEITPEPTDPVDFAAADCSSSGTLDIGDVVCVVNVILGPSAPFFAAADFPGGSAGPAWARLREVTSQAAAPGGPRIVQLEADLSAGVAGVQARVSYDPDRVSLGNPLLSSRAGGMQLRSFDAGGELVILIYNMQGQPLDPGEGPLVSFSLDPLGGARVSAKPELALKEVLLADRIGNVTRATVDRADLVSLPTEYRLSEPYPNPAGAEGTKLDLDIPIGISPSLSGAGSLSSGAGTVHVQVEVYNVRGQLIRRVIDAPLTAGRHVIEWDGRNEAGSFVGSGLYVMRVNAGSFADTRKLIVAR